MKKKIRIQIESPCTLCEGHGQLINQDDEVCPISECGECDGTGFLTEYVTIEQLWKILNGGSHE